MKDAGVNVTPSHRAGGAGDRWVRGGLPPFSAGDTPSAPSARSTTPRSPAAPPVVALSDGGREFSARELRLMATELAVTAHNAVMDCRTGDLTAEVLEVVTALGDDVAAAGRLIQSLAVLAGLLAEVPAERGRLAILSFPGEFEEHDRG